MLVVLTLAWGTPTSAATLFWSGNGSTQGGTGTWDTSSAHFGTSGTGPFTTTWNNTTNAADTVTFGGSAGTVTLGANITVSVINLNNNTTLTGASSISRSSNALQVNVGGSSRATGASINAPIAGNGLTVAGTGGPLLLGAVNTFSGTVTIGNTAVPATYTAVRLNDAGAIPGGIAASGGSANINLNGGVIGLTASSGDFLRGTGTGNSQVQWTGGGGFAAYGGGRTVTLSGGNKQWNSASFVPAGSSLVLGATNANSAITFTNNINFAGSTRSILVEDGSSAVDAIISGQLGFSGGANGGLSKSGGGVLALTGSNLYTGTTAVTAGMLQLGNGGVNGVLGASSGIGASSGATFAVNRSNATSQGTDFPTISGAGGFSQLGSGTTTLNAINSYTGPTAVEAGGLIIDGTVGAGAVSVAGGATLGGVGLVGGNVSFASGSKFIFNAAGPLAVAGTVSFVDPAAFGVDDIIGLSNLTAPGTYSLISGNVLTAGLANLGVANSYDLGSGVSAYFEQGSLNLVVVPEPGTAIAGLAGFIACVVTRRRRKRS